MENHNLSDVTAEEKKEDTGQISSEMSGVASFNC